MSIRKAAAAVVAATTTALAPAPASHAAPAHLAAVARTAAHQAAADGTHRLDVGLTINDHGTIKGSGSFTNTDGHYYSICVVIQRWQNIIEGWRDLPEGTAGGVCENGPGPHGFSAEPVRAEPGHTYRTVVRGWYDVWGFPNHAYDLVDSNRITT